MTRRNPKAGLTLLETMIALAIMAMLAAMLSSALNLGILTLGRSEAASDEVAQALARRTLRDWIEHALPSPMPNDDRALFQGTAEVVSFLADLGGSEPRLSVRSPALVSYDPKAGRFIASQETEASASASLAPAPSGTAARFEYWGRVQPDQPPQWHQTWSGGAGLPDLVRITFAEGGVPPLVVRPGKAFLQTEMSLSSLLPPALPSRP